MNWYALKEHLTSLRIRHIAGSRKIPHSARIVVLCRVENGEEYIADFLRHYRALGVDRFIFLDTGSADQTIRMLKGNDVSVFRTNLPFKTHRLWMRRWLMRRCQPGQWMLNVDIDELFDYPHSDRMRLPALVNFLEGHQYTAMRAHMLDCFASGPLGTMDAAADAPLIERYPWFDMSDVQPINQPAFFTTPPAAYRGGIRKTVFKREHFWLTKHPLIRAGSGVRAFEDNEHSVRDAHIADVTGVLLHFKFTPNFGSYVRESVRRSQHWNESGEYRAYAEVLREHPAMTFKTETAQRWTDANALASAGFLETSEAFEKAVQASGSSTSSASGSSSGQA